MEDGVLVVLLFSLDELLESGGESLLDWVFEVLLDVGEQCLLVLVGDRGRHRVLGAVVAGHHLGRDPEGPGLSFEDGGVVGDGA